MSGTSGKTFMTDTESPGSRQDMALLDATGLRCPMPLLKAKKALNELPGGALLKVIATDPGSERDFETFSRQSGHALLESGRDGEAFVYVLRKKNGS
jgi:TusA-related sulfurtransferase